ncbi:ATP-binding cassette domain-containing protein [Neotabrizicola shimadae]|uniref:ATP-binding cassette domain-containing protein n=1 Tax=Neotabrizicola shimadae TaxID=2807096 RepID=A0A8G1EE22_9RHOB|nr:ATP-binding cassette domain-containing protein [Neotabrizicola shimadae]QYZ70049.1 ATP-binding cassette domain-containing protein [Neotabrizicola shimadae]
MRVGNVVREVRGRYAAIWLQSVFGALLSLTPFLFMMQITERVYASRSWETLGFLVILCAVLVLAWGMLDHYRSMALSALGYRIDNELRQGVYDAVHVGESPAAVGAFSDIAVVRQGLTGPLVESAMDASLSPIFITVLFILNIYFGLFAIAYLLVLAALSLWSRTIWQSVRSSAREDEEQAFAFGMATAARRDTIRAMNILPGVRKEWAALQDSASQTMLAGLARASRIDSVIGMLQLSQMIMLIGIGAVLYLNDEASINSGFAAFIVMIRGVGPAVSLARNLWTISELRAAWGRLDVLLADRKEPPSAPLPEMKGQITCENLSYLGSDGKVVLSGVRFSVPAGSVVGVVGPSGAGKSTLLRLLAGAAAPTSGSVKIDGFPIEQWPPSQRGPEIGYLPQSIDLLPGSIWQNVTRFAPEDADLTRQITEALDRAGATDIVQARGRGLGFRLGENGAPLSGGQRQRIALARAFFGDPTLLVLDEPNSALDASGEATLLKSMAGLRERGSTIFFSTHKLGLLWICDYIVVIMDGYMHSFSTRDDILARLGTAGNTLLVPATATGSSA